MSDRLLRRAALTLGIFLMVSGPVVAFENDYPALFEAHADKVNMAQPGLRRLELPGPVVIEEITHSNGTRTYRASDQSGLGAAGCGFGLLVDLVVRSGFCEGMLSRSQHSELEAHLWRVARFVGDNAYPRMSEDAIRPALVDRLQFRSEAYISSDVGGCPQDDAGTQDLAEMAKNLSGPAGQAAIDRLVSLPRLPVMDPC